MAKVYFAKPVGQCGPIKIGYSQHPRKRMKSVSREVGVDVELLAFCDGGPSLEKFLHRKFADCRSNDVFCGREWFSPTDDLYELVHYVKVNGRPPMEFESVFHSQDALIDNLGGNLKVAEELGLKPEVVGNWKLEGRRIPWRWRHKIAKLAKVRGVKLPREFGEFE